MDKIGATSGTVAVEKMAPPTVPLLPDKRSVTNGHSLPAGAGKTTNMEKKPLLNGYSSPSHLVANVSSNHVGKPIIEGFLKTDDRMRLAKERREERERSLAAREQLIREKERRAQLQYERTVEERWKRLEEQKHKEELRRAAVEEKRRQQLEEERERLEALMRRSLERSLHLEHRHKRWSRGCPIGAGDSENAPLSFSAASALSHGLASPLPAVSESAPCSPRRSPLCNSRSPADSHRAAGVLEGSRSTPNTPKKERLHREKRTGSPRCGLIVRRSESPAHVIKQLTSTTTSKLASKTRTHSPSYIHEYHHSPTRHRPTNDKKSEDKKTDKHNKHSAGKNNLHIPNAVDICKARSSESLRGDTPEKKGDFSQKNTETITHDGEKKRGKAAASITNAEEASRLLAERRRQARAQKELEDKKREQADEERLKEEQLRRQLTQEQRHQQQEPKDRGKNGADADKTKQEGDKQQQDVHEKELMEREKAKVQAQEEAERQRQDREHQVQQEEEERQLRKKRIEEIMKRTRKGEADVKDEQVETKSPPGEGKAVLSEAQKYFKEYKDQGKSQGERNGKKDASAQMDQHVHNSTQQVMPALNVPDKKLDMGGMLKQREVQVNKQPKMNIIKAIHPFKKAPTNETDVKGKDVNGVVRDAGSVPKRGHVTTEVNTPHVASSEKKTEVAPKPRSPPVIHLESLEVKRSCDEMQPMDVSPTSKEELISITEFSPVNEIQHCGISNTRALQDLMDLTGSITCSKVTSQDNVGDCNKNLIEGVVSPMTDSKLIGTSPPSSNQVSIH
ncbi:MAP7 domain-containing protein 2a isoform X2 [Dunckerocampus dactyliophorus]|uniref:MAP7 domain-containing protein 2a isoform X2 n=1 Tax=Dunckerocampus dactyliophorus TaxID=161453 RepID=UPI00240633F6|nr:MAP7 domain-containing protein 2a isoform X2 [Dunckerocampus dactyliophorus]